MRFSKEFLQIIAHFNPALYDVIFPQGPLQYLSQPVSYRFRVDEHQAKGSVTGTDFSGDLRVIAKFSWRMQNLIEDLRAIIVQAKVQQNHGNGSVGYSRLLAELIDEYCGNGRRSPFPPRPHWVDDVITFDEKVGASILISQAAAALKGTDFENAMLNGADQVLNAAYEQVSGVNKATAFTLKDVAIN